MPGKSKQSNRIRDPWKTSMLTLCLEPTTCIGALLCPCIAYYNASRQFEEVPADTCEACCGGICCCCGFDLRSRLRSKYNLKGHDISDFCIHCWCHCCGIAQILREAKVQNKLTGSGKLETIDEESSHRGKVPVTSSHVISEERKDGGNTQNSTNFLYL